MSRYTEKDLRLDVDQMNLQLTNMGSAHRLKVNPRNGQCAVDLHEAKGGKCLRMLECGKPQECYTEARYFVVSEKTLS